MVNKLDTVDFSAVSQSFLVCHDLGFVDVEVETVDPELSQGSDGSFSLSLSVGHDEQVISIRK